MTGKVVIIGLDGATWSLLDQFIEEGEMPNLEELREEGASGVLKSTVPPASIPAWPSMVTGMNPAKHGIYDFTYGPDHVTDTKPIYDRGPWHLYDDKKMSFVNVPGTYGLVERGFNGEVVSGMFTPSGNWETPDKFTYPEELGEEIVNELGDYHIDLWGRDEIELLKRGEKIIDERSDVMNHMLDTRDNDFFWGVYISTDRLMHRFMSYMDEGHPYYEEVEDGSRRREALKNIYSQLDNKLGEVRDRLDDDDILMIVSDHGFQTMYWNFDINQFLKDKGYIKTETDTKKTLLSKIGINKATAEKFLRDYGGEKLLDVLSKRARLILKNIYQDMPNPGTNENMSDSSVAYSTKHGLNIHVNSESKGGPVPEEDRDEVAEQIVEDLKQFQRENDLEGYVKKREEFLDGENYDEGPEISLFFRKERVEQAEKSKYLKPATKEGIFDGTITAWHDPDGIFVVSGKAIESKEMEASIYDVVPTAMHMLGGKIPEETDGKVLDVFKEDSEFDREPERVKIEVEHEAEKKQKTLEGIDI